ncbi:hypothetical protein [Neorhodopirellula pilleata]|uniref:Uncharacterized protein n=1 Tax=Neorhodopirellula pilleata TaxID=2714738 RepID=A0A5C6A830_9BACT|nr:hypothetical protein Pla100_33310 [Neorhodopirellula pilleata]
MGDDIGIYNLSAYHQGMMGYDTPSIDRLAREGGQFMSYYDQQNCTATTLLAPILFDLEVDPFERAQEGMGYVDWWYRRAFIAVPVQNIVGKTLMTFKDFPPRQKPASFTIDQAMEALMRGTAPGSK